MNPTIETISSEEISLLAASTETSSSNTATKKGCILDIKKRKRLDPDSYRACVLQGQRLSLEEVLAIFREPFSKYPKKQDLYDSLAAKYGVVPSLIERIKKRRSEARYNRRLPGEETKIRPSSSFNYT